MAGKAAERKARPTTLSVEDVVWIQQRKPRLRHKEPGLELYQVPSLHSEAVYQVANRLVDDVTECSCPAWQKGGIRPCKHVLQVKMLLGVAPKREIVMEPWKGKDALRFEYRANDATWVIVSHQKDKDTGEVEEHTDEVPHAVVQTLYDGLWSLGADKEPVEAANIWEWLIGRYGIIGVDRDSYNGGTNRARHYFPHYWRPMRVLEFLGYVRFGSKTTEILRSETRVSAGVEVPS